MTLLPRPSLHKRVEDTLDRYPVVLLLGPRQCGKTTLARRISHDQDAPKITKGMRAVRDDLALEHLYVVYSGSQRYPLDEGIETLPLGAIEEVDAP